MHSQPATAVHLSVSIVLHHSDPERLRDTLDSLHAAVAVARDEGLLDRLTLHLVDNASGDAYRDRLEAVPGIDREAPRWHLLPANVGFGAGHNAALEALDSSFHLVLNPDVELAPDALARGLEAMLRDDGIALLCPAAQGSGGEREFLCKAYPSVGVLLLRGFAPAFLRRRFDRRLAAYELRAVAEGSQQADVEIGSGCFMLLRSEALRAVGGFDERFFLYFEDFDLSLRLRAVGRVVYDPAMCIVHHGGYAARKGVRHIWWFARSGARFFARHGWRWM